MSLFQTLIRYLMMIGAGWLVNKGFADQSMIEPIIGVGMTIAALGWFLFGKFFPEKKASIKNAMETENY